jgi:hypothetical protein
MTPTVLDFLARRPRLPPTSRAAGRPITSSRAIDHLRAHVRARRAA